MFGEIILTVKELSGNQRRLVAYASRPSALGLSCDKSLDGGLAEMLAGKRGMEV